ncbi:MAG TPA: class I SAM-dependent methyltransferase [Bryobacteraceae bacterium]|nr:class I SAM-dependent methyltransferase [Bryobacteraceae bacterium]
MSLRGFLDVCNAETIAGWSWNPDDAGEAVYVELFDGDVFLAAIRADTFRKDLLDAGIGDGRHAFEFCIPRSRLDGMTHRVSARARSCPADGFFELTGSPQPAVWRAAPANNSAPVRILGPFPSRYPWQIEYAGLESGEIVVRGWLLAREPRESIAVYLNRAPFDHFEYSPRNENHLFHNRQDASFLGFTARRAIGHEELLENGAALVEYVDAASGDALYDGQNFYLPRDLFGTPAVPGTDAIRRIAGRERADLFLLEGYTAYRKLENILHETAGRTFADAANVLDWGCGCGRLMRYLARPSEVLAGAAQWTGADIDAESIAWCRSHLTGDFVVLPLLPPSPLPDHHFDLILGVSVLTHLNEETQRLWLEELQRVSRPGAILLLSYHGEASVERSAFSTEWVDAWLSRGFDAGIVDHALDQVISEKSYYRAAFHTTGYIHQNWSKYFEILAIKDSVISNHQNLAILKRR